MIRTVPIPRTVGRMGCAPGAGCCSECGGHGHLGDASADTFSDFLAGNPDLAAQVTAYQATNEPDAVLQQVMYNPVTGIVGPVPASYGTGASGYTGPSAPATSPTTLYLAGAALIIGLLALTKGRR